MCEVLNMSPSGYYARRIRYPSVREIANQKLTAKIEIVYSESYGIYGSPRIHGELRAQHIVCSKNRVARLMRLRGIRAKQSKWFKSTTRRNKRHRVAANLLNQDFTTNRPHQK